MEAQAVGVSDHRQRGLGRGGIVFPATSRLRPTARGRVCAKIIAPALPRFSLPPRMVEVPVGVDQERPAARRARRSRPVILGVSGANWSSIRTVPSAPYERRYCRPRRTAPRRRARLLGLSRLCSSRAPARRGTGGEQSAARRRRTEVHGAISPSAKDASVRVRSGSRLVQPSSALLSRSKKPWLSGHSSPVSVSRNSLQQIPSGLREPGRGFDHDLDHQVAMPAPLKHRHAARRACATACRTGCRRECRSCGVSPSSPGISISPPSAAVVKLIGTRVNSAVPSRWNTACAADVDEDVEVARRRAVRAASPLPDRRMRVPLSTPGGNFDVELLALVDAAFAAAVAARASRSPRRARGSWGRPLDHEEALLGADLAVARGTSRSARAGARRRARAVAGLAGRQTSISISLLLPWNASSRLISRS